MNTVYQGCVYVILPLKTRFLGRFSSWAEYTALLNTAVERRNCLGVAVHGVVNGCEVSGEMTPREAKLVA